VKSILKGIGQGIGLILGIIATIMIMQVSAFFLAKMGFFGEAEKQKIESIYGEEKCQNKTK